MPIAFVTRLIKDGAGALFGQWTVDKSGTGAGPYLPVTALMSADGSGVVSIEAQTAAVVDAIGDAAAVLPTGAATDAGLASILAKLPAAPALDASIGGTAAAAAGDVGASTTNGFLRWIRDKLVAGITLAAGSAVIGKTVAAGPDYQATGVVPITNTISSPGTTAALTPKAGRTAHLWLSGGTSAAGLIEYSPDGTNWFAYTVEGTTLRTLSYTASGGNQVIPISTLDEPGIQIRARFTAVSGNVSYRLSQ